MALTPNRILILLLAALVALLAGAAPATAANGERGASERATQRGAAARISVGAGRALKRPGRCSRREVALRKRTGRMRRSQRRRMKPRQRRVARRARNCRRRRATGSSAPAAPLFWGAWIGDQLTGDEAPWDLSAVDKFEQMAGKPLSLIHFSSPFADCSSSSCSYYDFPAGPMDNVRKHGAIPFFSWASQSTPAKLSQPDFQLGDVISGAHDSYIRSFAEEAHEWGHPFFLRFNWEMNGGWFAWSEGVNGNQPGEYVAAWRHVHDIFTEVGATNATWVWCPNVDPNGKLQDLAPLYPGDEYVDWTGLDGYNWGTNPVRPDRWRSFDDLYRSTYEQITETIAPSKPLVVGEVGSTEHGGSKESWVAEALDTVPANYPKIHGLLWFEKYDDGMDWPIETSSGATSAFATGIQNPAYVGNGYGSLGPGTIQPPS